VLVDLLGFETRPGDRYLLCSDGLSNLVDNDEIGAQLLRHDDPERASRALVDLANERGGDDNITVIVVQRTA
jgi:protein phosphatase